MSRTLVIDNYDSYTYIIYQNIWKLSGVQPILIKNDSLNLEAISKLDFQNIVISPGPGTPTNKKDIGICREILDRFPDKPILGVCLGHQLLGLHYGGQIIHAPQPMHGKYSQVNLGESLLFEGIPRQIEVVRYHSLIIDPDTFPADLEIIAETQDDQLIMGVQHKEKPFFGVQFHPESIGTAYGEQIFANFLQLSTRWSKEQSCEARPPRRKFRCTAVEWLEPEEVFATCFGPKDYAFWLDSSLQGMNGRFSFMGTSQEALILDDGALCLQTERPTEKGSPKILDASLFDYLNEKLVTESISENEYSIPFQGGWLGYFGYETTQHLDLGLTKYESSCPQSLFMWVDRFLTFDYEKRAMYVCSAFTHEKDHAQWLSDIENQLKHPVSLPKLVLRRENGQQVANRIDLRIRRDKASYLQDIRDIQKLIFDGETYETCLTNEFAAAVELDPFYLYRILRLSNPAPYAAYLQMPAFSVLSSSPECFCTLKSDGRIKSEPIKGTRSIGKDEQQTEQLATQLRSSAKDHAELLMIIDLIRNDLSMICQPGTVKVPELVRITQYATVLQASSLIEGQLLDDISPVEALQAIFPGGSITGAPKRRTMQIIDHFEQRPRGVYTGCIGYFSLDRAAEFNIAIRTLVYERERKRISFGSGGAVLADSDPEGEFEEILVKAYALLRALNLACFQEFDHYHLATESTPSNGKMNGSAPDKHQSLSIEELFRLSADKVEL
jgi:para-aminobenzoate synthetase